RSCRRNYEAIGCEKISRDFRMRHSRHYPNVVRTELPSKFDNASLVPGVWTGANQQKRDMGELQSHANENIHAFVSIGVAGVSHDLSMQRKIKPRPGYFSRERGFEMRGHVTIVDSR